MKKSPVIDTFYAEEGALTAIQSEEFNNCLTSIAGNVYISKFEKLLPAFITDEYFIEHEFERGSCKELTLDNMKHNWHLLLKHINTVFLPELYIVFQHRSMNTNQRRDLHHSIDLMYRQLRRWSSYSPVQIQVMSQNRQYEDKKVDNYCACDGNNAEVANELLSLVNTSVINTQQYLDDSFLLLDIFMDDTRITNFLLQDGQEVIYQLNHWLTQRLTNFSQPSAQALKPYTQLLMKIKNPLTQHIGKNVDFSLLKTENTKEMAVAQQSAPTPYTEYDKRDTAWLKNVVLVAVPVLSISLLVIGTLTASLGYGVAVGIGSFIIVCSAFALKFINSKHQHIDEPPRLIDTLNHNDADSKKTSTDNKSSKESESNNSMLPLSINRHAYDLKKLLADENVALLTELITIINQTHEYLPYLKEHHAYLESSVYELLMDVSVNTINRLNQQARTFVKQGRVEDNVKALFARDYEVNIAELLHNHVKEITALNESILAKQMAGFNHVGSNAERQFRDSVMELKILLNWFVAQADDGIVCGYTMMQQKLESEMLVTMEEVYYKHDTTTEQRVELQRQVAELLGYFKAQSPNAEHRNLDDDIFKLTDAQSAMYQSETQHFIDFNKHYVKQIKQYW